MALLIGFAIFIFLEVRFWAGYRYTNNSIELLNHCNEHASEIIRTLEAFVACIKSGSELSDVWSFQDGAPADRPDSQLLHFGNNLLLIVYFVFCLTFCHHSRKDNF